MQGFFLKSFFSKINSKKINYCVWGNYDSLPEGLNGSDLDLYVGKNDKESFRSILHETISSFGGKVVSYFETKETEHFRILGFSKGVWWGVFIDVFYDGFFYKGTEYIPRKYIELYLSGHKGIVVSEKGFSFLAGFLKELLHNGEVKSKYVLNCKNEINNYPEKYSNYLKDIFGISFYKMLIFELGKSIEQIDYKRLRKYARQGLGAKRIIVWRNNFKKIFRFLKPKPGFTIVFLGTDGSGKSTIIENIRVPLLDAFHNAVYYEHMRPNYFPSIASLFSKENTVRGPVSDPHGRIPSGFVGSLLRLLYYTLDYSLGYFLKIWVKRSVRSCVWIFDRYYYDYLIDPMRARIQLPRAILKIGRIFIPEPDIIFCLGANAQIIHHRKPELPLSEVERQVVSLKRFCSCNKRAVWIDTGKGIEESTNDTMVALYNMMSIRFRLN